MRSAPHNTDGFSLIELMVVVAIIAVLATFAYPQYVLFQVRAARAEMYTITNAIYTAGHSYHAENEIFYTGSNVNMGIGLRPDGFQYGLVGNSVSGPSIHCSSQNDLGFSTSNCEKLRYYYQYMATGGLGNLGDLTMRTRFTVIAQSRIFTINGAFTGYWGNPITSRCKPTLNFYTAFYWDYWTKYESGSVQPINDDVAMDAVKSCL